MLMDGLTMIHLFIYDQLKILDDYELTHNLYINDQIQPIYFFHSIIIIFILCCHIIFAIIIFLTITIIFHCHH